MNRQSENGSAFLRAISSAVNETRDELIAFIQKLVQTPSLPSEEKKVQDIIAAKLKTLDLTVDMIPLNADELSLHPAFSDGGFPLKGRLNVVGRWPGAGGQNSSSLILNGHSV